MMKTLKVSDFDYDLPEERIASYPVSERGDARLMRILRATGELSSRFSGRHFFF